MDIPTHALMGAVVVRGFFPELGDEALCFVVGSVAPDVDLLCRFFAGKHMSLRFHQTYTHALPVIFLVGAVPALLLWLAGSPWCWYPVAFALGAAFHSFLDITNTYGLMLFAPFSKRRFCMEWLFALDMTVTVSTLATLLVLECVPPDTGRWLVAGYVAVMVLYWLLHAALARRARYLVPAGTVSVIPSAFVPWRFLCCRKEGREAVTFQLDALRGRVQREQRWPLLDAQYAERLGVLPEYQAMRGLSPLYHVVHEEAALHGTVVTCRDLRILNFNTRFGELKVQLSTHTQPRIISFRA